MRHINETYYKVITSKLPQMVISKGMFVMSLLENKLKHIKAS